MSNDLGARISAVLEYQPQTGKFYRKSGRQKGKEAGCKVGNGYRRITVLGKAHHAHRLAWFMYHGVWPKGQVDHINRKRSDNRIANLRDVSRSGNQRNGKIPSSCKFGIKGVSWLKREKKWRVKMKMRGEIVFIKTFDDFFEACCARKSAENRFGYNHIR